jgi:hypothetical protein
MKTRMLTVLGMVLALAVVVGPVAGQTPAPTPLSKTDVKELVANAKTAADHERLAQYFDAKATALRADVTEHEELAKIYRALPQAGTGAAHKLPTFPQGGSHCDDYAASLKKAAQDASQLATMHKRAAEELGRPTR